MKVIIKLIFQTIICLLLIGNTAEAQNWSNVEHISGENGILVNGLVKSNNKVYSSGAFKGTAQFLTAPEPENNLTTSLNGGFVLCHDLNGELIWANAIEATNDIQIKGIALDNSENIYITGSYNGISATFYSQNSEDNILFEQSQNHDTFIAKYDSNGNLLSASIVAQSSGLNRGFDIEIDQIGNVYIGGFWREGTLIFPSSSINIPYNSSSNWGNGFIAKFDSNFNPLWVSTLVGGSIDGGVARVNGGIALALDNGIYASGPFQKTVFFDKTYYADGTELVLPTNTYTAGNTVAQDVMAFKLNADGSFGWARHFSNSNQVANSGNYITSNKINGDVYFIGNFAHIISFQNAHGEDPVLLSSNGGEDNFIVNYNKNGLLKWAYSFGGLSSEGISDITNSTDLITASGYFSGTIYLGSSLGTRDTLINAGSKDAFLINLSNNGEYLSSTTINGILDEEILCIDSDSQNNVQVGGYFMSPNFKIGNVDLINGGGSDAFLAKHINIHVLPTISEITCSDANDGALRLEVFGGGQEPYTYELSKVDDTVIDAGTYTGTLNFADLESGVYRFVVTDALDRIVTKFYHLVAPEPIVINETVINVTGCYGNENGEISLSVLGGVGDYTYFWDTPNGYGLVPNAQNQSTLTAGTYIVTVTDANGCIATESFEILQPAEINFGGSIVTNNASSNPLNPDGSVNLIINNGVAPYTCSWKGPNEFTSTDQSLAGIRGGTYILSLKDASGCKTDTSFNIGDEKLFNAIITQTTNPKCKGGNDGTATVDFENITGGISIGWSNEQTDVLTATNLSVGHYSVTLTDDMKTPGDTSDDVVITLMPVLIGEPDFALGVTPTVTKTTCPADNNGSIQLTVNGWSQPYEYDWSTSDGSGVINGIKDQFGLTVGSYSYTVTDKYGCAVGSSVNLSSNYSAPSFTFDVNPSNTICEGTEVIFSASEGFLYQFYINDVPQGDFSSTNTLTITEPADGTRVRAVGMNTAGCTGESEEIVLTVTPNVGIPTFTSGATTLCSGTTETYVATADDAESIVYSIESGTAVVDFTTGVVTNINSDFTIRATAHGYNGCGEELVDLEVTVNPIPEPVISTIDNLGICTGDDINVEFTSNISGAENYQWFKNNEVITGANESSYTATTIGIYSLEVTENGCSGLSNELEIIQIDRPEPIISTADPLEWIEGESISVTFTVDIADADADAYQWIADGTPIPGANTASFEATAIGEYSVLVTKGSCQGESNVIAVTIETIPHYNVMFKVESKGGNPIVNVKISVAEFDPIVTNEEGVAVLSSPKGDFNFQAVVAEYNTFDGNFTVNDKDVSVNIVMVPLGIAEDGILSVKLYPNPFSNEIKISDSELVTRVVITSISGQKVMDVNLEGINRINTQNLPAGVYLLKLYTQNGESKVFRMVKDQQ